MLKPGSQLATRPCLGSVLGRLDTHLAIAELHLLTPVVKIEGLAFQADGRPLLVADADDTRHCLAAVYA